MTLTSKAKSLIEAHEKEKNSKSWGLSVYVGLAVSDAADIAKRMLELEEQNKKLVEALRYYGSKSLGETGAWSFRKKFFFDRVQLEDVEFLQEPTGARGQKYMIGGKRARQALEAAEKGE